MSNIFTDNFVESVRDEMDTKQCPCGEIMIDLESAFRLEDADMFKVSLDRLVWIDKVTVDATTHVVYVCEYCGKHKTEAK